MAIPLPEKLSKPAQRALAAAGINRLEDFCTLTEKQVAALHGMGPTGIEKIKQALAVHGLAFAKS